MGLVDKTPRILLSAVSSGCGKTTMTAAILAALKCRGLCVQSYKSGPDYIDPMFHTHITQRCTYHTDPYFSDAEQMRQIVAETSGDADLTLIEGAMGFYDGIGQTCEASAYTVSQWLQTPVLLLVSPQGMGCSVSALCKGFLQFRMPNQIRGIVLNRVRKGMYAFYQEMIQRETGLPVYGYLPELPEVHLESRHLGLMTAGEVEQLDEKIRLLAETAEETLDLDGILQLAVEASLLPKKTVSLFPEKTFRLGVAQDQAFCFYYAENLKMLERCGAELVPFSPMTDSELPDELDGLYLGGGYPELYLEQLSRNQTFLDSLKKASSEKMPIFAECGGFLYLQEAIFDKDGIKYPMAGLLRGTSKLGNHLCRFGYITLTAQRDTILGRAGTIVRAHEFHYADSTENGTAFIAERPNGKQWQAVQATEHIAAGFPHLYFPSAPSVPEAFSQACRRFREGRGSV
ncbi:MAG: cobyrinate a,c-diamide synthase [Ruminococcus sp.]